MRKIILDVDTGSDDAMAILLALLSPEFEVLGLTSVNGNRNVDITTDNTLRVVDLINSKVPVYKGCHLPMTSTLMDGRRDDIPHEGPEDPREDVHGSTLPIAEPTSVHQDKHAVNFIIDTLKNTKEKITLVFVGPMTNLGMALRLDPTIVDNIEELVIMGGGHNIRNVTAGAEFNFWVDPEAAKIAIDCGVPITLVTLDATHQAYFGLKESKLLRELNNPAALFAADLIEKRASGYSNFQPLEEENAAPIHDALAIAALLDPSVLENVIEANVDISVSYGISDGTSLIDFEGRNRKRKPNAKVALGANREKFFKIFYETMKNNN